jgi:hypothetical protein
LRRIEMARSVVIKAFGKELEVYLVKHKYPNGRIAIAAIDLDDDEPWGTLSVNVPDAPLYEDEIIIKNYSENHVWAMKVVEAFPEMFEETGLTARVGYRSCPVYKFKGGL